MPEFRQDPIAGYWVAISSERSDRPIDFSGAFHQARSSRPCPFCPGNEGLTPPEFLRYLKEDGSGWRLRVIPNKFPALTVKEGGQHEVIVDSYLHVPTFGQLPPCAGRDLLAASADRFIELKRDPNFRYVQLFKNNGPGSGASLEHPHSQLLALPVVPTQVGLELRGALDYYDRHQTCVFCEMIRGASRDSLVVWEDEQVMVLAPPAPRFAFETWILPRRHLSHFEASGDRLLQAAGSALHDTLKRIEELLHCPPYNFLLHTAPLQDAGSDSYHWHIEILPRVSGIGGFEFGTGCYINTVSPEQSVFRLRGSRTP